MRKVSWIIFDHDGQELDSFVTRAKARETLKWYKNEALQPWMDYVAYPVKIVRQEWELIDERVVR